MITANQIKLTRSQAEALCRMATQTQLDRLPRLNPSTAKALVIKGLIEPCGQRWLRTSTGRAATYAIAPALLHGLTPETREAMRGSDLITTPLDDQTTILSLVVTDESSRLDLQAAGLLVGLNLTHLGEAAYRQSLEDRIFEWTAGGSDNPIVILEDHEADDEAELIEADDEAEEEWLLID